MIWDKQNILKTLRQHHKAGKDLSYNAMARNEQALVSAAAYHFGSYRQAVEKAGIDYAEVTRRPRWNRQRIIQQIKQARRKGEDLSWSAVSSRRDEMGRAAFASLQPRLFGSWNRALQAAGLDADDVRHYRQWNADAILFELKARARDKQPLNSGALQQEDPGLHAAAVRHFGNYDKALRAAGADPDQIRQRRRWTKAEVAAALKARGKSRKSLSAAALRREEPALYGAAVRLFGTFTEARQAAGLPAKPERARGQK